MARATDYFTGAAITAPIVLFLLAAGGWIANVVKIFVSADDPVTALFIIRCVGVFVAPVGAILGFL